MSGNPSSKCLIMSGNAGIGHQIASLVESLGWHAEVVHSDLQARDRIVSSFIDVVIADVDAVDLGGLAILAFCHHRYPAVITYAIAQADDVHEELSGLDAGGCQGYFYLMKGKMQLDLRRGMAAELATDMPSIEGK